MGLYYFIFKRKIPILKSLIWRCSISKLASRFCRKERLVLIGFRNHLYDFLVQVASRYPLICFLFLLLSGSLYPETDLPKKLLVVTNNMSSYLSNFFQFSSPGSFNRCLNWLSSYILFLNFVTSMEELGGKRCQKRKYWQFSWVFKFIFCKTICCVRSNKAFIAVVCRRSFFSRFSQSNWILN